MGPSSVVPGQFGSSKSCAEFHPPKTLPLLRQKGVTFVLEDTGAIFIVVFHVNYL